MTAQTFLTAYLAAWPEHFAAGKDSESLCDELAPEHGLDPREAREIVADHIAGPLGAG